MNTPIDPAAEAAARAAAEAEGWRVIPDGCGGASIIDSRDPIQNDTEYEPTSPGVWQFICEENEIPFSFVPTPITGPFFVATYNPTARKFGLWGPFANVGEAQRMICKLEDFGFVGEVSAPIQPMDGKP